MLSNIASSLDNTNQQIALACQKVGRPRHNVLLMAVSKRHGVEKIRQVYDCGQKDFGENYLNEALEKQTVLRDLPIIWHYIGHIQANKTRKIAENFAWVHTVDSIKVAHRLSKQRPDNLPALNICLQVNIDSEQSKSGLLPDKPDLLSFAQEVRRLPRINLCGLMCIPAPKMTKVAESETFTAMQSLQHYLSDNGVKLTTLSMGMSSDLESAISCGATIVRVGTAIFGQRPQLH
ncbi:MAG: YggS family pyridoxal phosphate-dependent enzyme [Ostreibacterium sp.]